MNDTAGNPRDTVADRIRAIQGALSPTETKISRVLLTRYPVSGLQSSQTVAREANVSVPSILRFLNKLGYSRYGDFQNALLFELEERRASPVSQAAISGPAGSTAELFERASDRAIESIRGSIDSLSRAEFDAAVQLLCNTKLTVTFTGGRFSRPLSEYLYRHLRLLRSGTSMLSSDPSDWPTYIADLNKRHLLLAIDVRRYQRDTVELATAAKKAGAKVILLTDPWHSPATETADVVLSARVESVTVFDSLAPMTLLVEMLASAIQAEIGGEGNARMRLLDDQPSLQTVG